MAIDQQLIDGRYTIIERIGKGAMGVVFKCHDNVLDRLVAVKQLINDFDDDPQLRRRFTQEARSAARLNHRNIITIYELHEAPTGIAIVMELLEGVDLATLLKGSAGLPIEVKLNMMAQVCDGLDYAHNRGIIHRDIKPANLHVSPAGLVKILDFGIARIGASRMTVSGGLVGTPDYMSPEQVMARDIDARSDLFAVGAVLYEMLAGSKPFKADSITALLMKIVREPHVPLRERNHYLPVAATQLVERLLAKDPNERPASAREVQEALLAISTERPVFDASTVAILASAVTATIPRTPIPAAPPPAKVASAHGTATRDDSSSKLASLALERGRALRESGDLAGAMKVFRSVLELAPGNAEALRELEEMEHAFARMTTAGRLQAEGFPARPSTATGPAAVSPPAQAGPAASAPARVRVSNGAGLPRWAVVASAVIAVIALAGAGVYLRFSRSSPRADEGSVPAAQPASTPSLPSTAATSPPPADAPASPPAAVPPPAAPARSTTSPAKDDAGRRTSAGSTTGSRDARPRETAPAETAPPPAPAAAEPSAAPSSPPVPAAEAPRPAPAAPASAAAVVVRHFHNRSLRKVFARGACDGELQLLPDGLHFRTTSSTDGRSDDKKILFKDINDADISGGRIRIETDEQNWEFGAAKDVLSRIEQHIKANRKEEK